MKKWYQSKTNWTQIIGLVMAALAGIQPYVQKQWAILVVAGLMAILTFILRTWFTDTAIQK